MAKSNTQAEIKAAAKRMFYENGFEKSSISSILQGISASKSILSYYYSSKAALGMEIYNDFILHKRQIMNEKYADMFGNDDILCLVMMQRRLMSYICHEDFRVRRFINEIHRNNLYGIMAQQTNPFFSPACINDTLGLNLPETKLALISLAGKAVIDHVEAHANDGTIQPAPSYEETADFLAGIYFRLSGVPEDIVQPLVEKSHQRFAQMSFTVKPYFEIE